MKKIFIGLFFVFINFNINGLNLMPAFVGYLLIYLGLGEAGECPSLRTSRHIALAATIVGGLLWVLETLGGEFPLPVGLVFQLLVTYRLVVWAEELASKKGWAADRVGRFRAGWYALAICGALTAALFFVGYGLALLPAVAFMAVAIFCIYTYYHIWKDSPVTGGTAE